MKNFLKLLLTAAVAVTLSACSSGSDEPVQVVANDATIAVTPTTTAAIAQVPFTFPAGVPSFGTTSTTTVTFTDTSTTPGFTVVSGGHSATGTTTFGSCDFKITASDFDATLFPELQVGKTIVVQQCSVKVNTKNIDPNAPPETRSLVMLLESAVSNGQPIVVDVLPNGNLTINGKSIGTVTIVFVTGT